MKKKILFIGLDVDDKFFSGCGYEGKGSRYLDFKCKPSLGALDKKLQSFKEEGYDMKICYEATYLGYSLQRDLENKGYECEVIAPSLIPEIAGKKIKTNKIDSRKLATYYSQGNLTKVYIPDKEEETMRDLLRSRKFLQDQIKRLKVHITSMCRRQGLNYREEIERPRAEYWTQLHREWLSKKINESEYKALKLNLSILLNELCNLESSLELYDKEVEKISEQPKYKRVVKALSCYRGVDILTALTLVLEIGDIRRFDHPRRLTSYAGLDLIEYSSGDKERRFGISKMGNRHIRTGVVESCQYSSEYPKVSVKLKKRRKGVDAKFISIADRAMKRLYTKGTMLLYKGKPINKVKVACARELLSFVWESLREAA